MDFIWNNLIRIFILDNLIYILIIMHIILYLQFWNQVCHKMYLFLHLLILLFYYISYFLFHSLYLHNQIIKIYLIFFKIYNYCSRCICFRFIWDQLIVIWKICIIAINVMINDNRWFGLVKIFFFNTNNSKKVKN